MYLDNPTGSTTSLGSVFTEVPVVVFVSCSVVIVVVIGLCSIQRCHKNSRKGKSTRGSLQKKQAISLEDVSMISTSSKAAPKKPVRKKSSVVSKQRKQSNTNYENVFVGVYRGNFAAPSESVMESSYIGDNDSSASDLCIENSNQDTGKINYEEQCDRALERHISVRYENNNDQFDDVTMSKRESRNSKIGNRGEKSSSVEISISVNSRV